MSPYAYGLVRREGKGRSTEKGMDARHIPLHLDVVAFLSGLCLRHRQEQSVWCGSALCWPALASTGCSLAQGEGDPNPPMGSASTQADEPCLGL